MEMKVWGLKRLELKPGIFFRGGKGGNNKR